MLDERIQSADPVRLGQGEDRLPLPVGARPQHGEGARLRGRDPEPRAPLPRDRLGGGARGARQAAQHAHLPGMRRHAPAARGAPRQGRARRRSSKCRAGRCGRRWSSSATSASRAARAQVAERIVREIANRLEFLVNVGLDYLSLERSAETLSGGEAQRIRLASQIGSGLTGVMYVLDEPSIGLHQRDNARLIEHAQAAARPRQLGDRGRARRGGDPRRRPRGRHGPGRGRSRRARSSRRASPAEVIANPESLTGRYLARELTIAVPRRAPPREAQARPDTARAATT